MGLKEKLIFARNKVLGISSINYRVGKLEEMLKKTAAEYRSDTKNLFSRANFNVSMKIIQPEEGCNICGCNRFTHGPGRRLSTLGYLPRCVRCNSMERHRALRDLWNLIPREELSGCSALQFSADLSVDPSWFKSHEVSVYSGENSIDIQKIERDDNAYDIVICNHVMEHVENDSAAASELMRVLKPDGILEITVPNPISHFKTRDWGVPNNKEHGHIRIYGRDIERRLLEWYPKGQFLFVMTHDPSTHTDDFAYFVSMSREKIRRFADAIGNRLFCKVLAS